MTYFHLMLLKQTVEKIAPQKNVATSSLTSQIFPLNIIKIIFHVKIIRIIKKKEKKIQDTNVLFNKKNFQN